MPGTACDAEHCEKVQLDLFTKSLINSAACNGILKNIKDYDERRKTYISM